MQISRNPKFRFLASREFLMGVPLLLLLLVGLRETLPHLPVAVVILAVGFWLEARNTVAEERKAAGLPVERKFWEFRGRGQGGVAPKRKKRASLQTLREAFIAEEFFNGTDLEWFDEIQRAHSETNFEDTTMAFESNTDSIFSDDSMSSSWMDD